MTIAVTIKHDEPGSAQAILVCGYDQHNPSDAPHVEQIIAPGESHTFHVHPHLLLVVEECDAVAAEG